MTSLEKEVKDLIRETLTEEEVVSTKEVEEWIVDLFKDGHSLLELVYAAEEG